MSAGASKQYFILKSDGFESVYAASVSKALRRAGADRWTPIAIMEENFVTGPRRTDPRHTFPLKVFIGRPAPTKGDSAT